MSKLLRPPRLVDLINFSFYSQNIIISRIRVKLLSRLNIIRIKHVNTRLKMDLIYSRIMYAILLLLTMVVSCILLAPGLQVT